MKLSKKLAAVGVLSMSMSFSAQALTNEQYKNFIFGGVASATWLSIGATNTMLSYFFSQDIPFKAANYANMIGTLCGAAASGAVSGWKPNLDSVSVANIAVATARAGSIIGSSTVCRWVTASVATAIIGNENKANANAAKLTASQKTQLKELIGIYNTNVANFGMQVDKTRLARKLLIGTQKEYQANHCDTVNSIPCIKRRNEMNRELNDFEASVNATYAVSKDIAVSLEVIENLEGLN